jgi:hypothetical protein
VWVQLCQQLRLGQGGQQASCYYEVVGTKSHQGKGFAKFAEGGQQASCHYEVAGTKSHQGKEGHFPLPQAQPGLSLPTCCALRQARHPLGT